MEEEGEGERGGREEGGSHTHTHTSHLVHMKDDTLGKSQINTFPRRAFLLNPVMFALPPNINSI